MKRIKARLETRNAQWLATQPLYEQDQIREAVKTWRGTWRYLLSWWKR